jgi:hypothetical protein
MKKHECDESCDCKKDSGYGSETLTKIGSLRSLATFAPQTQPCFLSTRRNIALTETIFCQSRGAQR